MGATSWGRAIAVAGLVAALVAGIAACGDDDGGGENETLDEDGFEITFEYPSDFDLSTDISTDVTAGDESGDRVGVGVDDRNVVALIKNELTASVDSGNLAEVKPEFDGLVAEIAGRRIPGEETEVAGLPALSYPPYDLGASGLPELTSRVTVVFDGSVEYQFNCQWDDEHEAEIQEACDLALSSAEQKS